MRVLILATGRTGSTQLMKGIADGLDYNYIAEPWNLDLINILDKKHQEIDFHNLPEDVVVKVIVNTRQFLGFYLYWTNGPYNTEGLDWLDTCSEGVFWYRFAQRFDKVIILDRYDIYAKVVSAQMAQAYNLWDDKYVYDEKLLPENIDELKIKEEVSSALLKILSWKLSIDITYYEELYDNIQKENYFNLPLDSKRLFDKYLNTKYRYQIR